MRGNRLLTLPRWEALHAVLLKGGDPAARTFLADAFHFHGPAAHFDTADAYLKASGHAGAGTKAIVIDKILSDESDVLVFYTLHLNHRVATSEVAEWLHLENGRIVSSRLVLNTAPSMARNTDPIEYAVDPVCHMQVDKAAPAAIRQHESQTYYFCSAGCAEAFSDEPERFLDA